jgi:hypothetical protein
MDSLEEIRETRKKGHGLAAPPLAHFSPKFWQGLTPLFLLFLISSNQNLALTLGSNQRPSVKITVGTKITVTGATTPKFNSDRAAGWPAKGGQGTKGRRREDCFGFGPSACNQSLCAPFAHLRSFAAFARNQPACNGRPG